MIYTDTIEYLYGLQKHGMKFGLDNIQRLMALLGGPHKSFFSIHVAGTNGKGSTSAMIESLLRTKGARTGLFSPRPIW
jgi:dihydrofolate synthase/folylpolyglutamate synthase